MTTHNPTRFQRDASASMLALLLCACGGSDQPPPTDAAAAPGRDAASDAASDTGAPTAPAFTACGDTPRLLVPYPLPDAGVISLEAAQLALSGETLVVLSNWVETSATSSLAVPRGALQTVPLDGGPVRTLASLQSGAVSASQDLVVTDGHAFWVAPQNASTGADAVLSVDLDGGATTTVATAPGLITSLASADDDLVFADTSGVQEVDLDDGGERGLSSSRADSLGVENGEVLYATDLDGGTIALVAVDGGDAQTLEQGRQGASFPVACGADLCWLEGSRTDGGRLVQAAPGYTPVVIASGFPVADWLSYDGESFFVVAGNGELLRIPADGGPVSTVQTGLGVGDVVVDDRCVYWSTFSGVYSVSKDAP